MAGFFRRLFGHKTQAFAERASVNSPVRRDFVDAVTLSIADIMNVNFDMMCVESQTVPKSGTTGSLRSRGYLLGVAEGVITQFDALIPTDDERMKAIVGAFAVTYGRCDWQWVAEVIDKFQANNQDVYDGFRLGWRDVMAIYSGQNFATPTGFWLLNNGDEDALRYNLASL